MNMTRLINSNDTNRKVTAATKCTADERGEKRNIGTSPVQALSYTVCTYSSTLFRALGAQCWKPEDPMFPGLTSNVNT